MARAAPSRCLHDRPNCALPTWHAPGHGTRLMPPSARSRTAHAPQPQSPEVVKPVDGASVDFCTPVCTDRSVGLKVAGGRMVGPWLPPGVTTPVPPVTGTHVHPPLVCSHIATSSALHFGFSVGVINPWGLALPVAGC